jgi:hypothetical protein
MASKRRLRRLQPKRAERECGLKEQLSKDEAIGKAMRVQGKTGVRMTHYRCSHCKFWHIAHALTHKPKNCRY